MKLVYLVSLPIALVASVAVHWFAGRSGVFVETDECLLRLRESLNNTARNVVYEDNRRIAKILQGFVVLRTEIDLNFERFMRHYIGYMTFEETRAYSAPLAHLAGNESLKLQKIYHPMIIIENRATQFQFLFDSIKFSLDLELLAITKALQAKPEAKACWLAGKEAVEMLIKAIGVKVDEVFRVETRDSKPEFEMIGKSVEQLAPFIEGNYGRRCVNEDIRSQMTRCVWESMNGQRHMISIEFIKVRLRTDRLFALKFEAAKLEIEEFVQTNMRELRKILQKVVINCVENFKK